MPLLSFVWFALLAASVAVAFVCFWFVCFPFVFSCGVLPVLPLDHVFGGRRVTSCTSQRHTLSIQQCWYLSLTYKCLT